MRPLRLIGDTPKIGELAGFAKSSIYNYSLDMFFNRRSYIELVKKKVLLPIYWDFRGVGNTFGTTHLNIRRRNLYSLVEHLSVHVTKITGVQVPIQFVVLVGVKTPKDGYECLFECLREYPYAKNLFILISLWNIKR